MTRVTRRRVLLALLIITIVIPQVLAGVAKKDSIEGWRYMASDPGRLVLNLVVLAALLVVFLQGMRGDFRSLNFLAGLSFLVGAGTIAFSFFASKGPFQLAATGLCEVATALVLVLLRDDVAVAKRSVHARTSSKPGVKAGAER